MDKPSLEHNYAKRLRLFHDDVLTNIDMCRLIDLHTLQQYMMDYCAPISISMN